MKGISGWGEKALGCFYSVLWSCPKPCMVGELQVRRWKQQNIIIDCKGACKSSELFISCQFLGELRRFSKLWKTTRWFCPRWRHLTLSEPLRRRWTLGSGGCRLWWKWLKWSSLCNASGFIWRYVSSWICVDHWHTHHGLAAKFCLTAVMKVNGSRFSASWSHRTFFEAKISVSSSHGNARSLKAPAVCGRASWAGSTVTTELCREPITQVHRH